MGLHQAFADEVGTLPAASRQRVVMHRVAFASNTATIAPETVPLLDEAIQTLAGADDRIAVVTDTETVGDDPYLLMLARRRAKAVRRYLVGHGIAAGRVLLTVSADGSAAAPVTHEVGKPPVELHLD